VIHTPMPLTPAAPPAWLSTWMSVCAALSFLRMLSVPSGYSVGGGLLAGIAILAAAAAITLSVLPAGHIAESRYAAALDEWHAYTQQGDATNNVGSRLEAWKAALISIPERPLLGWGHEQYDAHLQELIEAGRVAPFVGTLANTHNQFVEIWLHQGGLGLISFLALLIVSFWYFCRRLRS